MPPKKGTRKRRVSGARNRMGEPREVAVMSQVAQISTLGRTMPFPPSRRAVLTYTQNVTIGTSATANLYGTSFDLNLNSLFLPTSTGNHQPLYFDQFAAIYSRYKVYHAHVEIVAAPVDPTTIYEFTTLVSAPGVSGTISGATTDVVLEKPWVQSVKIQGTGAANFGKLEWDIAMPWACSVPKRQFDADIEDYAALVSASPARIALLQCGAANISASAAQNVRCTIVVRYSVLFFDLNIITQS